MLYLSFIVFVCIDLVFYPSFVNMIILGKNISTIVKMSVIRKFDGLLKEEVVYAISNFFVGDKLVIEKW